jgi:4a-hydroxytetrahydrobiopterin dehydratase
MAHALEPEAIAGALVELPGWTGDVTGLRRAFKAPEFLEGIRLVGDVADVAEDMDHHPDIDIRWRTVTFFLVTHSAGGVTSSDVDLAHRITELAAIHGAE